MMLAPHMMAVTCEYCRAFIIDIKTGKPMQRGGVPQRRKPGVRTPCHDCPKKSPANERYCMLSRRNVRTVQLYLASRSGSILNDAEKNDNIILENFALLEHIFMMFEQRQNAESIGLVMARMLGGKNG